MNQKHWKLSGLFAFFWMCGAFAAPERVTVPLENGVRVFRPGMTPQWMDQAAGKEEGKAVVAVAWEVAKTPRIEVLFRKSSPVPAFARGIVRAKIRAPEHSPVNMIALRFQDRDREFLQWRKKVDFRKGGVFEIEWEITPENANESWGNGTKNRIIDFPARPSGFGIMYRKDGNPEGTLTILSITFEVTEKSADGKAASQEADASPDAVAFRVLTDTRVSVLRRGRESALKYRFSNTAQLPGTFSADVTMRHYSGKTVRESFRFSLAPGEVIDACPASPPPLFGYWEAEAVVRRASSPGRTVRHTRSFAYLEPSGPTPERASGFLFGVCSHTERWQRLDREREVEAAALCGAKVVRSAVEWNVLQRSPDTIRWELMDWLVDSYGASGIELQVILGFTPRWAAPASLRGSRDWRMWNRSAPDPGAWRSYVRAMAGRYRGRIRFWEVWNEPDLSVFSRMTLAEYIALQKSAFAEIRASAPEAKVMTGGFAMAAEGNHPGQNSPTFQADFLKAAKGSFDIHAVHQHGAFARYAQAIDEAFLPMRRRTGVSGVPWYANETAVSSVGGMERMQAETLFKKLIFTWSRGAVGYTWYDLRNDGTSERNAEHHYGMLTHDFQVKPVYPVFNLLAGHFRNAQYLRQWKSADDLWIFEFQAEKPGVFLIPAWNESPFAASVSLAFSTDAKDVRKFDLMGNSTPVILSGGRGIFEVGAEPAFLRLEGAGFVRSEPACVSVKGIPVALPGRPLSVRVLLRNSNVSGRTCILNFAGKKQRIVLGAEKTREVRCEFPADAVSPSLAWETSDGLCGVIRIPLLRGRKILPEPFADRAPDFLLRDRKFVFSLTSGNPALAHRIWSGPEDLSAKGWIGVSNGMLKLRFEVVDDIHSQKHRGVSLWQGDSVQAALQFPAQNGYWEFGFSLPESGAPETMLFQTPRGFDGAAVSAGIRLRAERSGTATRYDVEIPLGKLGVVAGSGSVFRFNFLVNDNDGEGRDGWIALAPGIGEGAKSPDQFPLLVIP